MSETGLNRTGIILLTNTSGSIVHQGDVVVMDLSAALSFRETGIAAKTGLKIGVDMEKLDIQPSVKGMVAFSGYVQKINLSNMANVGDFIRTDSAWFRGKAFASPGAGDFAIALTSGSTPQAWVYGTVP